VAATTNRLVGALVGVPTEKSVGLLDNPATGSPLDEAVGGNVRRLLGSLVGDFVDNSVDNTVGVDVGGTTGRLVGTLLGDVTGTTVGTLVGTSTDTCVGDTVGIEVTTDTGTNVGTLVAATVGDTEGTIVNLVTFPFLSTKSLPVEFKGSASIPIETSIMFALPPSISNTSMETSTRFVSFKEYSPATKSKKQ